MTKQPEDDVSSIKEQRANNNEGPGSTQRIAALNDALRCEGHGGRIMLTRGVQAMGEAFLAKAMAAMRAFAAFDARNDPYGEHDCALITVEGQSLLWKIDYYDTALSGHSPDPADPEVTCRVLTLMLADEY